MSRILSLFVSLVLILLVLTPVSAYAADSNVGNEVVDAANTTLTRTGAGTAANPYKLQLNLSNSNTWLSPTIFNSTLTVNDVLTVTNSVSVTGDIAVNGGDITSTVSTGAIFNTNVTTLNLGGAATSLTLGASTGTATVQNATIVMPNATAVDAASATANFNIINSGGGYGTTGVTMNSVGNIQADGTLMVEGAATVNGTINANGGTVGTTASTGNLFNTNATTVNMGGAAASLTLGANTGTATVRNTTISFPNAAALNATSAAAAFNTLSVGGGYGATGLTVTNTGNVSANGNVVVDGTSTLDGNITTNSDVAVNGGDITTFATTATLFNTNATTVNIAGAATAVTMGATVGTMNLRSNTVNFNNATTLNAANALLGVDSVNVGGGFGSTGTSLSTNGNIQTNGNLSVDGTTTLVGAVTLSSLSTATGDNLCLNSSNQIVKCSAGAGSDLQAAYNNGNTITTTDNRNISYTLSDTSSDSGFVVTTATGATGYTLLQRANGSGSSSPSQMLLVDNLDTDDTQSIGVKIQSESGGMTTALDVSDADITTALSVGSNDISGTNFSVTGSTGSLILGGAATFNLSSNQDMMVNTDSDSNMIITGLSTGSGEALCVDASDVVVKCSSSFAAQSSQSSTTSDMTSLEQTVQKQQEEINILKQEIESLKSKLQ